MTNVVAPVDQDHVGFVGGGLTWANVVLFLPAYLRRVQLIALLPLGV
jgi:hypothetical protein